MGNRWVGGPAIARAQGMEGSDCKSTGKGTGTGTGDPPSAQSQIRFTLAYQVSCLPQIHRYAAHFRQDDPYDTPHHVNL